jgi:hypothetical protein
MVKCTASGSRLELEFIVTGSARFKVSAAALGFSTGSTEPAAAGMPAAAAAGTAAAGNATRSAAGAAAAAGASVDEEAEWQGEALEPAEIAGQRCHSAADTAEVGTATWGACSATADDMATDAAESQQQQQGAELGSTPPTSSSSFMQWKALRRSSAGGGGSVTGSLGRSSSYMRSLGSSVVEGALRSRLVKTADGEYWVNVEAFTLQFR